MAQMALTWELRDERIASVLIGVSSVEQLDDDLGAVVGPPLSDEELREIDTSELLKKISSLEIQRWKYKGDESDHIGPYAEDFKRAFGLGDSDKHIHLLDLSGVALAGIKELEERLNRLEQFEKAA